MRIALPLLVLIVLVAATPVGATGSGLYGIVTKGPVTPVCRETVPCDRPAAGVVLAFSRAGKVTRATTRQDGSYRVRLAPGWYAVAVVPALRIGSGLTPRVARVVAGRTARRDFSLDTGIR